MRAGVADLAAGLGVERRAVEEDGRRRRCRRSVAWRLVLLAPGELGGPVLVQDALLLGASSPAATPPALRAALARRRCSAIAGLEAGQVDLDAPLSAISWVTSSGKP